MMRNYTWIALLGFALAISPIARAQETTLAEIVKGEKLPTSIAPKDLPTGAVAFKITVAGQSGQMDSFMGLAMFSMPMMSGGSGSNDASIFFRLMELSDVVWTSGKTISFGGDLFVVTYKYNVEYSQLIGLAGPNAKKPDLSLRLNLLRQSAITSISPRLDITRDALAEVFKKVAEKTSEARDVPGEATTAPAEVPMPETRPADVRQAATDTLGNAKQVATGLIIYTADYDDVFPYPQSTRDAAAVVGPYLKNNNIWSTLNPNGGILQFNMCIGGVAMTSIENPAEVPLVYDSVPWPDGTRIVGFADGHAKKVNGDEWTKITKYLKLKLKKVAKPLPPGIADRIAK